MRFQFCGGISCPEWFLAEISVLTKITAIKMRLVFTQLVENYLTALGISDKLGKLLSGTGLNQQQISAVIATLSFILQNSVRLQILDSTLNKELVDLGLPKENAESISKIYKTNREKLIAQSSQIGLSVCSAVQARASVHEFYGSDRLSFDPTQFQLSFTDCSQNKVVKCFTVGQSTLDQLIFQLEDALQLMRKTL